MIHTRSFAPVPEEIRVLKECTIQRNILKLPYQLDRKLYQTVSKKLQAIGGKWKGGNTQGFVFDTDPTELLASLTSGKSTNLVKDFQYFPTPAELASEMVYDAGIEDDDTLLEPSAGQGAIINAILDRHPGQSVHYCELMETNRMILKRKFPGAIYLRDNFLHLRTATQPLPFTKIIANPPFSNNQDIDHIRLMYDLLLPGGRIVAIASKHWTFASGKKETAFRNWLDDLGAVYDPIPAGTFKESGTMIETVKIIIDKG